MIDRSGADSRLFQILTALREDGHAVTYLARSTDGEIPYAAHLTQLGIKIVAGDAERLRWAGEDLPGRWNFETVLRDGDFDLAILFHWFWSGVSVAEDYLGEIQRLSPRTLAAVLTDDFHGLRERRAAELSGDPADWERSFDFTAREFEVYRRADRVLSISKRDRQAFLAIDPKLQIELLPMAAQPRNAGPVFAERSGILFLANFANPASAEGVRWFLREVWPNLKSEISDLTLDLVGNQAPAELAPPGSGIHCLGHVPDLDPIFARSRVFVSPIRFGTGVNTKNLLALAHGLPLVTTTVGAEGLRLVNGEEALVADAPSPFARAVIDLYTNPSLWKKLAESGRRHVSNEFSEKHLKDQLRGLVLRAQSFHSEREPDLTPISFRRVEAEYPEVLTYQPREERVQFRIERLLQLGERLLEEGKPREAREQLRHIFSFVKSPAPQSALLSRVFAVLDPCYQKLGQSTPYRNWSRSS